VIVIIGIIAAIAVPRISRGAKGAAESAVKSDLAVLRQAIDMYSAEHNGLFPGKNKQDGTAGGTNVDFVAQLTKFSDVSGKCGDYDAATGIIYGPYLRNGMPPLPVGPNATATDVLFSATSPPTPDNAGGWVYNQSTGELRANTSVADESGKNYDAY
jgi:general secretion pathway protein G